MTVITSSLSDKKLQKEPLVQTDVVENGPGRNAETGRTRTLVRVVRNHLQPVRERGVLTSTCIFLTAFLLFCGGIAACGYMYQQYQVYQVRDPDL